MRSIVGRDNGESYNDFLTRVAKESGIGTPRRADLAKLDRKRPKEGSNKEWEHPHDPDARITKDGRTHLAHKVDHAVDMKTDAVVDVTVQGADEGDTTTIEATLAEAARQMERLSADGPLNLLDDVCTELVTDKDYHSNDTISVFRNAGIRTYISEPDRGRRN